MLILAKPEFHFQHVHVLMIQLEENFKQKKKVKILLALWMKSWKTEMQQHNLYCHSTIRSINFMYSKTFNLCVSKFEFYNYVKYMFLNSKLYCKSEFCFDCYPLTYKTAYFMIHTLPNLEKLAAFVYYLPSTTSLPVDAFG